MPGRAPKDRPAGWAQAVSFAGGIPGKGVRPLIASLRKRLAAKQNGAERINCDAPIWAVGSAVSEKNMFFCLDKARIVTDMPVALFRKMCDTAYSPDNMSFLIRCPLWIDIGLLARKNSESVFSEVGAVSQVASRVEGIETSSAIWMW